MNKKNSATQPNSLPCPLLLCRALPFSYKWTAYNICANIDVGIRMYRVMAANTYLCTVPISKAFFMCHRNIMAIIALRLECVIYVAATALQCSMYSILHMCTIYLMAGLAFCVAGIAILLRHLIMWIGFMTILTGRISHNSGS